MEKQVENHLLALVLINTYFKAFLTFFCFFALPNAKGSLIDGVIGRLTLPFKCKKGPSVGAGPGFQSLSPGCNKAGSNPRPEPSLRQVRPPVRLSCLSPNPG